MRNLLILTVFSILVILACQPDGPMIEVYDEGKLYETYFVNADSLKHGNYQRFYRDGNVAEDAYYVNGKLDGKRSLYYHSGQLEIEEIYVMDSLHGTFKSFYPSGKLEFTCEYIDNKIQGIAKKYYESGQLMEEVQFKDNQENGPFTEYYDNGVVEWKGHYLNGDNEFGLLEQFDRTGNIIKKMECDSFGICTTIWKKDAETN